MSNKPQPVMLWVDEPRRCECPYCASRETIIKDTRRMSQKAVRRRRLCRACGRDFGTTGEE